MSQDQLTLEGMIAGVRDSAVFLLVLSKRYLAQWFCQQEMLAALDENKPIQIVLEEDERFHSFDLAGWQATKHSSLRHVKNVTGELVEVPKRICEMIDSRLSEAVTYRRRDFETDSMMRELCRRNGVHLPHQPSVLSTRIHIDAAPSEHHPSVSVFIICNEDTGAAMLKDLRLALETSSHINVAVEPSELDSVDCILLLLSAGALSTKPLDEYLERAIATDKAASRDRIEMVFSKQAGWVFGCAEHKAASDAIRACIDAHEAMEFRPRDDTGPNRHEFYAMVEQLVLKLCRVQYRATATGSSTVTVDETFRDELQRSQCRIAALDAEVAHLNRLVMHQNEQLHHQNEQLVQLWESVLELKSASKAGPNPPTYEKLARGTDTP